MELAAQGKTRRFWVQHGLLLATGGRFYVPNFSSIRRHIIKDSHETPWAGNLGQRHTRTLIDAILFLPWMWDDIDCYVQTCLLCQQDKVKQRQPGGLLEQLPVAEFP